MVVVRWGEESIIDELLPVAIKSTQPLPPPLTNLRHPRYIGGTVASCFRANNTRTRSTLPFVLKRMMGMKFVGFTTNNSSNSSSEWDMWATCSTSAKDRIPPPPPPPSASTNTDQLVMFLPGRCQMASKAGLWHGLETRFGTYEAAKIAPRTIVRPTSREREFREYVFALAPGNVSFVLKSGHRQRGIQELTYGGGVNASEEFIRRVLAIDPRVIQLRVESHRYRGRRTAFRTYVWVECKLMTIAAEATIDWNSPAYVAPSETDLVASGYTAKSKNNATEEEDLSAHELLTRMGILNAIQPIVTRKVGKVLAAFGQSMCRRDGSVDDETVESLSSSDGQRQRRRRRTMELFAFDWMPTEAGNDAMLLEANRFPDMDLHHPGASGVDRLTKKDWLKVCTLLRRVPAEWVLPQHQEHHSACLAARHDTTATMIE